MRDFGGKIVCLQTDFRTSSVLVKGEMVEYKGGYMNRLFATLAVMAMLLLAIVISVRQMLELGQRSGALVLAIVALALVAASAVVVKRHFEWQKPAVTRSRFAIVQPLRRLFSAVWS